MVNIVRVKLPSSSSYTCCPSGDAEYELDYENVLKKATPPVYEVIKQV